MLELSTWTKVRPPPDPRTFARTLVDGSYSTAHRWSSQLRCRMLYNRLGLDYLNHGAPQLNEASSAIGLYPKANELKGTGVRFVMDRRQFGCAAVPCGKERVEALWRSWLEGWPPLAAHCTLSP